MRERRSDPVTPPLFVGRKDIFNRIRGIWSSKDNPDSIILYGHRRMGKTSILRNLDEYTPPESLLVYANLQGEAAFAEGTHHLLKGLADTVSAAAHDHNLGVSQPIPSDYRNPAEAGHAFRRLLRESLEALPEKASMILALDEFETIDVCVRDKKIGKDIYSYLRTLAHEARITLVFAGLHTLDEMSRDYQKPFFESYVNIAVPYLSPEESRDLITNPAHDFSVNYHPKAVEQIIHETH